MTLLEALVALVILGVTATGFLQSFRAGGRAASEAADWSAAVAAAESAIEETLLNAAPPDSTTGARPTVVVQPWARAPREIDEVAATVTLPNGARYTLRRLVRRAALATPGAVAPRR